MRYVEAVEYYEGHSPSIFIAGGITNCPDWQKIAVNGLEDLDLTVYNPRRKTFDVTNPKESENQIAWEHYYLERADAVSFWFCAKEIQPITLLEFGRWSTKNLNKPIFVGVDPAYPRKKDVEVQLRLERGDSCEIVYRLEDLVSQIRDWRKTVKTPFSW